VRVNEDWGAGTDGPWELENRSANHELDGALEGDRGIFGSDLGILGSDLRVFHEVGGKDRVEFTRIIGAKWSERMDLSQQGGSWL